MKGHTFRFRLQENELSSVRTQRVPIEWAALDTSIPVVITQYFVLYLLLLDSSPRTLGIVLPIVVGFVLLIIIITIICYVKRKRSSNTVPAEPVPMVEPPPGHQRVLFVSANSRAMASTEIPGGVTNSTSLPSNTAVTTAEPHGLTAQPSNIQACAPLTSTAGTFPASSLHPTEPQTVPISEACYQTNFAYQPSAEPPSKYTPEDPVRGGEEDLYPPSTEQPSAPQNNPVSSDSWQVNFSE